MLAELGTGPPLADIAQSWSNPNQIRPISEHISVELSKFRRDCPTLVESRRTRGTNGKHCRKRATVVEFGPKLDDAVEHEFALKLAADFSDIDATYATERPENTKLRPAYTIKSSPQALVPQALWSDSSPVQAMQATSKSATRCGESPALRPAGKATSRTWRRGTQVTQMCKKSCSPRALDNYPRAIPIRLSHGGAPASRRDHRARHRKRPTGPSENASPRCTDERDASSRCLRGLALEAQCGRSCLRAVVLERYPCVPAGRWPEATASALHRDSHNRACARPVQHRAPLRNYI